MDTQPVLHLFGGGPYLTVGDTDREVPEGSKRLLVFVALHTGRVERRCVAGTLWPAGGETRAAGNLRSALWRLRAAGIDLIDSERSTLALNADVLVDTRVAADWAARLIGDTPGGADIAILPWFPAALDLLPGWYDDWVLAERERLRQRLLHALEALSRCLVRSARPGEAVEAAMLAVGAEPLRQSAQRVLIEAHLAEGNWIEGRRAYQVYRTLLRRELGTEPADDLIDGLAVPGALNLSAAVVTGLRDGARRSAAGGPVARPVLNRPA